MSGWVTSPSTLLPLYPLTPPTPQLQIVSANLNVDRGVCLYHARASYAMSESFLISAIVIYEQADSCSGFGLHR
ncbi:hypothetical protein [Myxacorys almedinensis]|uniref:Uncharacterized protein n=1 Tax=Myxacorys almedinensis A TaxID=2690445 RepID=A0A8J7Z3L7_9CYAN|nr:hypothetical protein [Myxacorys almedinensis]NDJ17231.1 hypothetical protein [Myxacorys almedinensis A]